MAEEQIISAVQLAWDPTSNQNLKRQAFDYVNQLRQEPSAWQPCLSIFTQIPKQAEVVRVFCLEIVNSAVQAGVVDQQGLRIVKEQLMAYLKSSYGSTGGTTQPDAPLIENKIAQTITYLFAAFYGNGWDTCFDDLLALTTKGQTGVKDNAAGTTFYLRVINSIHDEIGDILLSRSRAEQERANALKDLIRAQDVQKIAASWQEILGEWRMSNDIIAELCLKAVGKWVSWVDISLIVNQQMLELLFQQLERAQSTDTSDAQQKARDAAIDVFTETAGKKMPSADKVNLIEFLNLETIVAQLIACPPLSERRFGPTYDTDLAETVAKLVNTSVIEIVKILETENSSPDMFQKAESQLRAFLPHLLRFFSDEYDEVCSTVINAMNDVLAFLRKTSQSEAGNPQRAVMLLPILKAIFGKMRYDETSSWGDDDEQTDEAEFQDLRKRLGALQQAIAAADEQLYMDAISGLVNDTFNKLGDQSTQVNWRDLDLALYEMYLFGDLAVKYGGLYQKNKPNSVAAEKLVQMMLRMVQSNTGSYNHPAIQLQYMEICVRYSSFFEQHTQYIESALDNFLRLVHHSALKVKMRSWYLFQRFVRQLRPQVGQVAEVVVQNLTDLLVVKAVMPEENGDEDASSDGESSADSAFNAQLYLFEAVGCICGSTSVPADKQVQFVQAIIQPIFSDMQNCLPRAKGSDQQATLQIHHDIMALGTLARGFSDWVPGSNPNSAGNAPIEQVQTAFTQVSEATLLSLESLKTSFSIRTAARFAFSRLIGVMGSRILSQLPRWIDGLLTQTSTKDEMALFLRLLDQVIFGFKNDISSFLDSLFGALLQRVFSGLSTPASGTDDEIELAELKREYLNFLLVILNNDLGGVIVSGTNQSSFETVISTIEHFTKDADDFPTAKMAFQVLSKMCSVWGGPDVVAPPKGQQANGTASNQAALPGFDQFMMTRFSPLCWTLPTSPTFNAKDAQARQTLSEAAALQKTIYQKSGDTYLSYLKDSELRNMGMDEAMIDNYLGKLATLDLRNWKVYWSKLVSQGGKI